jgi:hypothetical protein
MTAHDNSIQKSTIMHPSGMNMVMLGGDVYDQRTTGDIISEFKWVNGEPVMLIYKRVLGHNTKAYMIELEDAHMFATSSGLPSKMLLSTYCRDAARALNSEHDKATMFRLIDVIMEGLADLLRMPPEPKAHEIANRPTTSGDELKIIMDGKTIAEVQV